jgi:hypothetical protein
MSNNLVPSIEEMNSLITLSEHAFNSKFCEKLGGKSAIFTIMARAKEIGMPPLEAIMGGMNIIQGKVEISPRAMNAMIRRAGHKLEILECNGMKCTIRGTRKDTGETLTVSYTIEDAKRANIYKGAWVTYPDDMNFKSALSKIARRLFADIISTSYVEGEILREEKDVETPRASTEKIIEVSVQKEPIVQSEKIEGDDPLIMEEQILQIEDMIGDDKELEERVLHFFEVPEFKYLRKSQFSKAVKKLSLNLTELAEKEAQ